jgi:hypothetical protein
MKGGTAMVSSIGPLRRWCKKGVTGAVLLVLAMASDVGAADFLESLRLFQNNKMPDTQQLRQSYANVTYRPLERREISFSIAIPKEGWRDIPVTISLDTLQQKAFQLILLARQLAPENEAGEARIEVFYSRLNMEMHLYDVVTMFLQKNRDYFTVLMRRKGRYNKRSVEEVLLTSEQEGKNYMVRLTFSRHGDRIFLVMSSSHESVFNRYAQSFAAAAVSFAVVEQSPSPHAEKMGVFTSIGRPELQFNYPESWKIKELQGLAKGRTGVDINRVAQNDNTQHVTTYGYIHASAFSKQAGRTPDRILTEIKKDFEAMPISFHTRSLEADLMPELAAPLGKLEKWDVVVGESPGQAAFLVLPHRTGYVALGLFTMRPEDNLLMWMHTWRVFEIIAGDLTGKPVVLVKLKHHTLPDASGLKGLVTGTMAHFTRAVMKQNFDDFYTAISNTFKSQTTEAKLQQAFRGFAKVSALDRLDRYDPIVEKGIRVDKAGLLTVSGHYPTQPEATTFTLTYIFEQTEWKLIGIHVAMKKMSPAAASDTPTAEAVTNRKLLDKINVLAAENGGQVIYCSSQYNATSWGANNLIDGQLGQEHGFASKNRDPSEIVFALPGMETLTQLCFNPYTVESPNTWAKRVLVEVSTRSPQEGFERVGDYTLHNRRSQDKRKPLADQCFDVAAVQARYIKLRLLSNHGGGYIELGEFKAFALPH